jgi:hypothetical protein
MKAIATQEQAPIPQTNTLQERITLLNEMGFLWREIAELADLPKKLVKGLAKGEFVLTEDEDERLCGIFDETINRLKQNVNNECPEQNIDAEDYEYLKLEVKSITLFKGLGDDKMIVQIHGVKVHD